MDGKDLHKHRPRSPGLGHEFETPIVKELPREMRQSERERRQTTSTQSDATLSDPSPDDCPSAGSDAPPAGS